MALLMLALFGRESNYLMTSSRRIEGLVDLADVPIDLLISRDRSGVPCGGLRHLGIARGRTWNNDGEGDS